MGNKECLQFTLTALFVIGGVMEVSSAGVAASSVNKTKELHIIAMVPFLINPDLPPFLSDKFGYHNAINMAAEHINGRSDILKDHKIKIHFGETFVSFCFLM